MCIEPLDVRLNGEDVCFKVFTVSRQRYHSAKAGIKLKKGSFRCGGRYGHKMKLAEALQERADLNRRIEQLNARLYRNSKVQQGRNPEEDPAELISELDGCISRLEYLIAKINICNCNTKTPDEKSITELIAKRDCLKIKIDAYRDLAGNASSLCDRVTAPKL